MTLATLPPPAARRRPARARPPAAGQVARVPAPHGAIALRRRLASQVVAWHNGHPLARRIRRRDLGGCGVVALPFSAVPDGGDPAARIPLFDSLPMTAAPPLHKVVALALSHGWAERPDGGLWPLREVPVGRGWRPEDARPVYLLTVALQRGRGRPAARLLAGRELAAGPQAASAGRGARPHDPGSVVGHRWLSRPRLAGLAAGAALAGLMLGAGLLWAVWPAGRLPVAPAVAIGTPGVGPVAPAARPSPGPSPGPTAAPALPAGPQEAPAPPVADAPAPSVSLAEARAARHAPRVGAGVPADAGDTRAAAPTRYRLVGPPQPDGAVLRGQAAQVEAALRAMGDTGGRLRIDVVGTPMGDALAIGPLADQAEAERVARRLAAHGIRWQVTEQP